MQRLVLIDLNEYRLNEPGNRHLWRGYIDGNVAVYEADAEDPDDPAFATTVTAQYPEESSIGLVEGEAETIELAALTSFGLKTGRLFYDHKVER